MAMEPEELRKLLKKAAIIGCFFVLAYIFYLMGWRRALVVYVVVVGVLAVLAILLQAGRGGGLAASLGGFGADSLLGAHSATPIAKATYVMLGLFIFIAVLAARMGAVPQEAEGLLPPPVTAPPPVTTPAPIQGLELPAADEAPLDLPIEPLEGAGGR